MKITVCAKCGSQDLERLAWVLHRTNQYIDDHILANGEEKFYCNNCGDGCDVVELQYLEKYGSAYRIGQEAGNDPFLIYYPMFTDGKVDLPNEGEVEIDNAFDEKEQRKFFEDMLELFPDKKAQVIYIFKPYVDIVKEFVAAATDRMIDMIFQESHEEFKTKSGDIEPMQELRLDRIKADLIDLVTEQVKQNME